MRQEEAKKKEKKRNSFSENLRRKKLIKFKRLFSKWNIGSRTDERKNGMK